MYAKLHKYEDVEKAAFEAISRHVKFILEGTRLKTLIKDHPEEIANLMVNINKNMQQNLDGVAGAGSHGGRLLTPRKFREGPHLIHHRRHNEIPNLNLHRE